MTTLRNSLGHLKSSSQFRKCSSARPGPCPAGVSGRAATATIRCGGGCWPREPAKGPVGEVGDPAVGGDHESPRPGGGEEPVAAPVGMADKLVKVSPRVTEASFSDVGSMAASTVSLLNRTAGDKGHKILGCRCVTDWLVMRTGESEYA